jgi:hypothetical protein
LYNHLELLADEFGYPQSLKQVDLDRYMGLCVNNVVWDIKHSNILKLCGKGEIIHAVHAFDNVKFEDLITQYGAGLEYDSLKWP